jgi:hypothetical protein
MCDTTNLIIVLNTILGNYTYEYIANKLNVAVGTVKRWNELNRVPILYSFQLMQIANMAIDYSNFDFKAKDQFFTPLDTAKYCFSKCVEILELYEDNEANYNFIEPSAGNGVFFKLLPLDRRFGIDIEPKSENIVQGDYLEWFPTVDKTKYIVIGNPPFGLRGQLALKFINHSSNFADYVCFILPQLFESDGKGVPRKRVKGLNIIHSEKLHTDFLDPDGKIIKVECIFQIWSKYHSNANYDIKKMDTSTVKIYSLSDGGTPSTTRNKEMMDICHAYIPSTCFGKYNMKYYSSFNELPNRKGYGLVFNKNKEENIKKCIDTDWSNIAFLSTNSACNIRTSQIMSQFQTV